MDTGTGTGTGTGQLWLVRHAQPLVACGVCYGALDVAADGAATLQAAHELASALPCGLRVHTSPLQRCKRLAQTLQGLRPDLTLHIEPRLAEMNFGCHEGQRWDQIERAALDAWTADFWQHRFGGAESVSTLMQRVAALWDAAVQRGQPCVWVTHAGVIRSAMLLAQGVRRVDDAALWPVSAAAFGRWVRLGLVKQ
ncbi:MAG: phosphoglycerate kinase [Comamonadaceae bacterium CG1_02_60_18]|nr:MAG: phosphoglycerate kinase [Comamonadaceae bacterium CG1_02_60_18]PIQ51102.1 MAG: phosphoglycerate kinase [Comamonadaceae bacterium CG12_big_fil_rev_8_21_14_0_65_59_15]